MYEKLTGLIAAPFTAFNADKSVNLEMIPKQVEVLLTQNVTGAYVLGSTGEGVSCSMEERKAIMSAWSKASGGRLKLIAHIGALALPEIKELARHAVAENYYATSVVPPTYFRPASVADMAVYLKEVASYAPELPFYYYHTMLSRLEMTATGILQAVEGIGGIPNLAGVKFNHHNLYDYQNAVSIGNGKYDIVFGVDEFFASALALGAKCFIGSTYNYSAELYHDVWDAFKRNDYDQVHKVMKKVCAGVDLLVEHGGIAAGKAMMLAKGIDCGPARLPLKQFTDVERMSIAEEMKKILAEKR